MSFPLFSRRFLQRDDDVPRVGVLAPPAKLTPDHLRANSSAAAPAPAAKPSSLRVLDLGTLPRDDGPPTELRTRKEKLAHYEQQCSFVGDRLFVGGEVVAKSLDILQQSHITHVINCVGFLYPPYFESHFSYQTLYLQGMLVLLCCFIFSFLFHSHLSFHFIFSTSKINRHPK